MNLKEFINTRMASYSQSLSNFNPRTVKIGNKEWMAEDLAIDFEDKGVYYNKSHNRYYYNFDSINKIIESLPGWELPSIKDWNESAKNLGAIEINGKSLIDQNRIEFRDVERFKKKLGIKLVGIYLFSSFMGYGKVSRYLTSDLADKDNYGDDQVYVKEFQGNEKGFFDEDSGHIMHTIEASNAISMSVRLVRK